MNIRILLVCLLACTNATAFTLGSSTDTKLKGFAAKTIYFFVNDTNCPSSKNVKAATVQALRAWNEVTFANLNLVYGGATSSAGFSNRPIISCDTSFSTTTGLDGDWVAGAGSSQSTNSRITSALVLLNAESGKNGNISNWSDSALAALIAHEIGHALGLGHSTDTSAMMYYSISRTSLYVAQDDIDGISYLYPRDELSGDNPLGCGTVASSIAASIASSGPKGPSNKWPLFVLLALPILLALGLRLKTDTKVRFG